MADVELSVPANAELDDLIQKVIQRQEEQAEVLRSIVSAKTGSEPQTDNESTGVGTRSPIRADTFLSPPKPVVGSKLGLVSEELKDIAASGAIQVTVWARPRRSARLLHKPRVDYTMGHPWLTVGDRTRRKSNPFLMELARTSLSSKSLQQRNKSEVTKMKC